MLFRVRLVQNALLSEQIPEIFGSEEEGPDAPLILLLKFVFEEGFDVFHAGHADQGDSEGVRLPKIRFVLLGQFSECGEGSVVLGAAVEIDAEEGAAEASRGERRLGVGVGLGSRPEQGGLVDYIFGDEEGCRQGGG